MTYDFVHTNEPAKVVVGGRAGTEIAGGGDRLPHRTVNHQTSSAASVSDPCLGPHETKGRFAPRPPPVITAARDLLGTVRPKRARGACRGGDHALLLLLGAGAESAYRTCVRTGCGRRTSPPHVTVSASAKCQSPTGWCTAQTTSASWISWSLRLSCVRRRERRFLATTTSFSSVTHFPDRWIRLACSR